MTKDKDGCLWVLAFFACILIIALMVASYLKDDSHTVRDGGTTVIIDRHSTRAPLKAPKTYKKH